MKHDTLFQHKEIFVNCEESGPKVYKSVFSQQVNMNGGKPIIIVNFNMFKSVLHNCNMKVHHIEHCQTKKKSNGCCNHGHKCCCSTCKFNQTTN